MKKTTFPTMFLCCCAVMLFAGDQAAIKPGDSKDTVISVLGNPKGTMRAGAQTILLYDRGEVAIEGDKVVKVDLISEDDLARKQAAKAEAAERKAAEAAKAKAAAPAAKPVSDAEKEKQRRLKAAQDYLAKTEDEVATPSGSDPQQERDDVFAQGMTYFIAYPEAQPIRLQVPTTLRTPSILECSTTIRLRFDLNPAMTQEPIRMRVKLATKEGNDAVQTWELSGEPDTDDAILTAGYIPGLREFRYRYSVVGEDVEKLQVWRIADEFYPAGYHASDKLSVQLLGKGNRPISNQIVLSTTNAVSR